MYAIFAVLVLGAVVEFSLLELFLWSAVSIALTIAGFYYAWRLFEDQGPIDPDGPMIQF
jgi:hypothetical protein